MSENTHVRPEYAEALRDELLSHAGRSTRPAWTPARLWTTVGLTSGIVAVGATAAVAAVLGLPGATIEAPIATTVVVDGTGVGTAELGTAPENTGGVVVEFICVDPGDFLIDGGPTVSCTDADAAVTAPSTIRLPVSPSVTVDTSTGTRWRVAATYVTREILPWGTNDRGETYGVINENGTPDLVSVLTSDGRPGYVRASDLHAVNANREITVYDAHGVTEVGVFHIRD